MATVRTPQISIRDERQITVPNGGLSMDQTRIVRDFFVQATNEDYRLKSATARQKDIGSQRDPNVVTEAVILTFERNT